MTRCTFHISTIAFVAMLILGCSGNVQDRQTDIVARVGPYELKKERVAQPYVHGNSPTDSAHMSQQFVEHWAMDKAFELEAMEKLSSRDELDQLIDAYRSSLLTHLFEKQIVEEELDSVITSDQLQSYYESNKSQYILTSSILRVHFIAIKKDRQEIDAMTKWWKEIEEPAYLDSLIDICHGSAEVFLLEDSAWYKQEQLEAVLPDQALRRVGGSIQETSFSTDSMRYFLRILERIPDTEIAPLSFIEKQARKVILYRRRQTLIREKRQAIFDGALKANRIKLY